ncbi:MAG: FliH/SctL family protein [Novosphingobium sp.]
MTIMSSLTALSGRPHETGFRPSARYLRGAEPVPARAAAPPEPEPEDPATLAFADGYLRGTHDAQTEAAAQAACEAEARAALDLAFTRLDAELAEALRQRLQETVLALCEATLQPFAVDDAALAARVSRAVAMLARAEDERVIRLNPDDLKLVSPRLPQDWQITPDPALPRGALRIETSHGGVEDGPAQWRRALAEALDAC